MKVLSQLIARIRAKQLHQSGRAAEATSVIQKAYGKNCQQVLEQIAKPKK